MTEHTKLFAGLLGLALTGMTAQAAAPALSYQVTGNNLILTYTGTLLRSSDAITWTEVASASSPYQVALSDKKLFFCAKASDEPVDPLVPGKNGTVSLPCGVTLDLNWIEPGTFMMGSPEDELGAGGDETLHEVTLTEGYWLGKYEVTQAQYEAVTGENPSRSKGADLPVENVSWNDIIQFSARLNELTGMEFRLPSEAEWEFAAKGGKYAMGYDYAGSDFVKAVAWFKPNSKNTTHPVGYKRPNELGIFDMSGNVAEWCLDTYERNYYQKMVSDNPKGPDAGANKVNRGGGWLMDEYNQRVDVRNVNSADERNPSLGFRLAM